MYLAGSLLIFRRRYINLQEEYIKDEQRYLLSHLNRIRS